jgi:hypothetical protein
LLRFQTAIKERGQGTEIEEKRKEERAKSKEERAGTRIIKQEFKKCLPNTSKTFPAYGPIKIVNDGLNSLSIKHPTNPFCC